MYNVKDIKFPVKELEIMYKIHFRYIEYEQCTRDYSGEYIIEFDTRNDFNQVLSFLLGKQSITCELISVVIPKHTTTEQIYIDYEIIDIIRSENLKWLPIQVRELILHDDDYISFNHRFMFETNKDLHEFLRLLEIMQFFGEISIKSIDCTTS